MPRKQPRPRVGSEGAAGAAKENVCSAFIAHPATETQGIYSCARLPSPKQLFGTRRVVDPLPLAILDEPPGECWAIKRGSDGVWRFARSEETLLVDVLERMGAS